MAPLRAGQRLGGKVGAVLPGGLWVEFLGDKGATVDPLHCPKPLAQYAKGQAVEVRVLAEGRQGAVASLLPALVQLTGAEGLTTPRGTTAPALVVRVDPGVGVALRLKVEEGKGEAVYVPLREVADVAPPTALKALKVGEEVVVRVLAPRPLDGCLAATLRPSLLSASVLDVADLTLGLTVQGTVEKHMAKVPSPRLSL